jgi:hypothetical protein
MANDEAAVSLVCASLEGILEVAEEEIDTVNEELRNDNTEEIQRVDWAQNSPEVLIQDPKVQEALLPFIRRAIEHFTYMNDGESKTG